MVSRHDSVGLFLSKEEEDKDPLIGPEEFIVGYSKAPEQR